ncbi:acyl-CoA thioesterase [Bradyrhizobium sp. B120]|uniref:acyl-CoA thioesterase n=1 Tax=Bradyrhizobium sp. B120 TaxID=3410088 RepID=UPI003B97ECC7
MKNSTTGRNVKTKIRKVEWSLMMMSQFDRAVGISLQPNGLWTAYVHPAFLMGAGAFGGWLLAIATRAILASAGAGMHPKSLSAEFVAAAPVNSLVTIGLQLLRSTWASERWRAQLHLADGTLVADITMLLSRMHNDAGFEVVTMPAVARPSELGALPDDQFPGTWVGSYEMRHALGMPRESADGRSLVWTRLADEQPMDFERLTALTDASIARSYYRPPPHPSIATVSLSAHYHCTPDALEELGDAFLLVEAFTNIGRNGYFDQDARIWSPDGCLLATSRQLVRARSVRETGPP